MTNPGEPQRDDEDVAPAPGPTDVQDDDTSGHSMATYEYARQQARERSREAGDWARSEKLRRESRSLIDRIRRR
jgi:hypothetical protein